MVRFFLRAGSIETWPGGYFDESCCLFFGSVQFGANVSVP